MRKGLRSVALIAAIVTSTVLESGVAAAAPVEAPLVQPAPPGPWGDFYDPPVPLPPGRNGDLIRTQPSHLAMSVGDMPGTATRILYRSEDTHGAPTAVSGTYIAPSAPWEGQGPRPLVVLAAGTQGEGRQCAPSMMLNVPVQYHPPFDLMTEYELPAMDALLSDGIAVVFTDYPGLGTPGPHPYANRLALGHAVLDAARAAQRLPDTGLDPHGPVGLWGYSEGGGAVASAAELQPGYAPDLDLKGVYSGAPPARDMPAMLNRADGTLFAGAIGYAINGFAASYPELRPVIDKNLNERGKQIVAATATQCDMETMQYGLQHTSSWTTTGQPLSQVMMADPTWRKIVEEQQIGNLKPTAPVLIASNVNDDLVPNGQVRQLAAQWCAKGATVQYQQIDLPPLLPGSVLGHGIPMVANIPTANGWMFDRFNGVPAPSNCAAL